MNVAAQDADLHSVLHFARTAFALRHERPELHAGDLAFSASAAETAAGLLSFERHAFGRTLVCQFNLGDETLTLPAPALESVLLSGALQQTATHRVLGPNGFVVGELRR
jgi:glycosidase